MPRSISHPFKHLCSLGLILLASALASSTQAAPPAAQQRQSVIDFEDETIEGLNKRPLDSLSQISEKDRRRKKPHLYRKRASFRSETAETLRIVRYSQ
ncbi:hypothetical protein WDW37_16750 [Bdellovibrionota bacterium FG-1]